MGAHSPGHPAFYLDFSPLRQRRTAILWTQAELAQRIGCHRITINRIERNRLVPSLPMLVALSRALGVPSQYLYTVVEE